MRISIKAFLVCIFVTGFCTPSFANSYLKNYSNQLIEQGYTEITIKRTFLGRSRILANKDGHLRELIVDRLGRILSDISSTQEGEILHKLHIGEGGEEVETQTIGEGGLESEFDDEDDDKLNENNPGED